MATNPDNQTVRQILLVYDSEADRFARFERGTTADISVFNEQGADAMIDALHANQLNEAFRADCVASRQWKCSSCGKDLPSGENLLVASGDSVTVHRVSRILEWSESIRLACFEECLGKAQELTEIGTGSFRRSKGASCAHCGKESEADQFKTCGRCGFCFYCSKECQTAAWRIHKKYCQPVGATKVVAAGEV
jgi:hypothetical protein